MSVIQKYFEPVHEARDYRHSDYVLLILILMTGTWLRFWNLGAVGLHGDEDIMALAARGVVEHGVPLLPSGMVYVRAALHTYILAASTMLFGDSEWSLRLPSAIVGSLCGAFAFLVGRRFLTPGPNLAFVALMTFLPAMIEISQTARMYVFLVASLLIFCALLFRWEERATWGGLLSTTLALVLAVHIHPIAIFAGPMLVFPGLARGSRKQTIQGILALGAGFLAFRSLAIVQARSYPDEGERLILPTGDVQSPFDALYHGHLQLAIGVCLALAGLVIVIFIAKDDRWKEKLPGGLLLSVGAVACGMLHYHLAAISVLFGATLWLRPGGAVGRYRFLAFGTAIGILMMAQFYFLHRTGAFPGRKIIGAFVGMPSVWPALRLASIVPIAAAAFLAALVVAARNSATGKRIPVYMLFFAIAVWLPLLVMGALRWDVAPRYTLGVLPFFLLSAVAGTIYLCRDTSWGQLIRSSPGWSKAVGIVGTVLVINPVSLLEMAQNSYRVHPDHKGAAEFVRSLQLGPEDTIIAEDSIVQTYYLGRVDYRLQNVATARSHSVIKDGKLLGQYTGTPIIGSGQELRSILDKAFGRQVYVIGDAQAEEGLASRNRANGIAEVLGSDAFDVVYTGRDGKTIVWKLRPANGNAR